jgi:hypothetical protein
MDQGRTRLGRRSLSLLAVALLAMGCAASDGGVSDDPLEEFDQVQEEADRAAADGMYLITNYTLAREEQLIGDLIHDYSLVWGNVDGAMPGEGFSREFLCSGFGVAMQGTGKLFYPDSDGNDRYVKYASGGGGWITHTRRNGTKAVDPKGLNDCQGARFAIVHAVCGAKLPKGAPDNGPDDDCKGRIRLTQEPAPGEGTPGDDPPAPSVAIDPKLIDIGQTVIIRFPPELGGGDRCFSADDTGGAIHGNRVDIYTGDRNPHYHFRAPKPYTRGNSCEAK